MADELLPKESEGPDRTRGSIRCREFHDLPNTDLGGTSDGCCCNPCTSIRPSTQLSAFPKWNWCCRCVPRVILIKFTPDDPSEPCCAYSGVPMFFNHEFSEAVEGYRGTYSNTIYGMTVQVDVCDNSDNSPPWTGTGTDANTSCSWRVRVWDIDVSPSVLLSDVVIPIDHATVTCLDPPTGTVATGVTGPTGCVGSLSLEIVQKSRLPFIERTETMLFNDKRDPRTDLRCQGDGTGTGTGQGSYEFGEAPDECQPEFINLCGECSPDYTTLTALSVNGALYLVDDYENGKPTFINGNRRLYWDGDQWILVEETMGWDETGTGTGTGTGTWVELSEDIIAYGPHLPDCPIGSWSWVTFGTGTGTGTSPNDRECFCVSDATDTKTRLLCGCCGQVCSRICVSGPRHLGDDIVTVPYATFTWFEDWLGDLLISRGWSYYNPVTDFTERILLGSLQFIQVDSILFERDFATHSFGDPRYPYWKGTLSGSESYVYYSLGAYWAILKGGNEHAIGPTDDTSPYGSYLEINSPYHPYIVASAEEDADQCYLTPRFEPTVSAEIYDPSAIDTDQGCSCTLHQIISETPQDPDNPRAIQIRCGVCSCWTYVCGTCRCIPSKLCVILFYENKWYKEVVLTWDDDLRGWSGIGTHYFSDTGSGDANLEINLLLQSNTQGQCVLVPSIPGYTLNEAIPLPVFECGNESRTHKFDAISDILTLLYMDGTNENGEIFYIAGSSLTLDCDLTNCAEASPCYRECGSHPRILHCTLTQWANIGDMSEPDPPNGTPEKSIDFELVFWQRNNYDGAGGLGSGSCGYIGFIPGAGSNCCPIKVELDNGSIRFTPITTNGCFNQHTSQTIYLATETCDPYYGDSGELYPNDGVVYWECLGSEDVTTRLRIIITE